MEALLQLDYQLFHLFNSEFTNSFLDAIMPLWRSKYFWFPVYLFIASFLLINYRRKGFFLLLAIGLTIGVSDVTSSRIVKNSFERLRPCNDEGIKENMNLLVRCGSGYSFTSSHATNHFTISVLLLLTLGRVLKRIKIPLILWAVSIAWGQVYVGVHYPFDVIGGAILGTLIAYIGLYFINKLDLNIGT